MFPPSLAIDPKLYGPLLNTTYMYLVDAVVFVIVPDAEPLPAVTG